MLPDVTALKIVPKTGDDKNFKNGIFDIEEDSATNTVVEYSKDLIDTATALTGGKEGSIRPFYNLPNIIDIEFAGPMGSKVDGFLPAVLTNVQVDYTGGQKFSTHEDGQPMHMQMVLNFLEIRILTLNNYELVRADDVTIGSSGGNLAKQGTEYNESVLDRNSLSNQKEVQAQTGINPGGPGSGPGGSR
jgi:hypothetical protein